MDPERLTVLTGKKRELWEQLLTRAGLRPEDGLDSTVLLWEDGELLAAGSRQGQVLKCIAVDGSRQGEGLSATLLTLLRQDALEAGHSHLFLYTKPENERTFSSLFFYPVAKTEQVLLMENRRDGIGEFLRALPRQASDGPIGAAVMHCNPFTRGHRYLIETAAQECAQLYVFVLSQEGGLFPPEDRLELVRRGTEDLPNVTVCPTGPYLISSATFPSYFLKDLSRVETVQCRLDAQIFGRHFAPRLGITRRYVGTEPLCPVTRQYNDALMACLPPLGVEVRCLPRLETGGTPISASAVRALLGSGDRAALSALVPESTLSYLDARKLIG